jgi:hypothetical protein
VLPILRDTSAAVASYVAPMYLRYSRSQLGVRLILYQGQI